MKQGRTRCEKILCEWLSGGSSEDCDVVDLEEDTAKLFGDISIEVDFDGVVEDEDDVLGRALLGDAWIYYGYHRCDQCICKYVTCDREGKANRQMGKVKGKEREETDHGAACHE